MFERPTLYFRRKDNGAAVYRVEAGQLARLDMLQIAVLKQNGEVKPSGKQKPTAIELTEIEAWRTDREAGQESRDAARVDNLVGEMNAVTQWIQASATDKQVSRNAQPILMALHDLRTTVVRRLSGKDK